MADLVHIVKYVRSFKIVTLNAGLRRALDMHNEFLVQEKPSRGNKWSKAPEPKGDEYFIYNEHDYSYYYINQSWEKVMNVIDTYSKAYGPIELKIEITEVKPSAGTDVSFNNHNLALVEPEDSKFFFQNDVVETVSAPGIRHDILEIQTGKGKSLADRMLCKTPYGWREIGKLKVGDLVIAQDGTPTKVLGVYPQGDMPLVTVEFDDGRKVECTLDHLWQFTRNEAVCTRQTSDIIKMLDDGIFKLEVPLCLPIINEDFITSVTPYALGALLGVTYGISRSMSPDNSDTIIDIIVESGVDEVLESPTSAGIAFDALSALGIRVVDGVHQLDGFAYVLSSAQLLALLRGLMDFGGRISADGKHPTFTTTNTVLSEELKLIIYSLGGTAATIVNDVISIEVYLPHDSVFCMYEMQVLEKNAPKYIGTVGLGIKDIYCEGKVEKATCIKVAHHSSLFITEGYVVTHNTAMAMKTIVNVGKRVLVLTKAGYVSKWTNDLTDGKKPSLQLKKGELLKISGLEAVDKLLELGKAGELDDQHGKQCKVILMSSHTLDLWLRQNLKNKTEYNIDTFISDLGIGFLLYDESHELFKMNYWSFILLNSPRVVDLTATIVAGKDVFRAARYNERFPTAARYNKLEYVTYVDAYSVYYALENRDTVRRMNSLSMYNHIELEKILIKQKKTLHRYFDMIYELLGIWYLKERQVGQRALVMFSSQDMCSLFKIYLNEKCPNLKVYRYIQGDDYDEFLEADIGVSTPGKSGTAVDIPGLILTLCTVCIGKEDKNLQILGRTREVSQWDIVPRIVYIHCSQLTKHIRYLNIRRDLLATKTNKFNILSSNFRI